MRRGRGSEKETIDDISGSRLWSQFLNDSRVAENDGQDLRAGAGHSVGVGRTEWMTYGLCEFLDGMNVLCSCSEHKVFLTDNGE